ncbi:MAG: prolyl oligopeptidase family serine peptidase, partial [Phycisphaerales bacterium]|nr:prolyl oligopeptidase family serine peptidase [Phycisphaerales bacterium]
EWTSIPPLTSRKIAFRIVGPPPGPADRVATELRLVNERGDVLATLDDSLGARRADERHSRTFRSEIDGSVQYYAVVPASPGDGSTAPGIVLSLHGASVQAARQAACYEARPWAHLVAPTNRRPFGFDWEDWGRLDAIEVLDLNQARLGTDPDRTWLTGHSMGGHGTWHLGVTYPDRFAAIAPSAGWISFRSYTGAAGFDDADAVEAMMARATTPSDTMSLTPNLAGRGIYVLHGDADDNVPVSEARTMRSHLATFHTDFAYYERPGAGHWWGKRCVDWPPLMSFLEAHAVDTSTAARAVSFVTANPGVSSRRRWVEVIGQERTGVLSRVDLTWDPETRRIAGSTVNVSRLRFDVGAFEAGAAPTIELDGAPVPDAPERDASSQVWLERRDGAWRRTDEPSRAHKGPHRNGGFKDAFRHRVMLVYGTQGTDEENAWAIAKARYDAETFWMRGNGSFDIVRDIDFDAETTVNRNVILYGNADTNAAWNDVLDLSGFTLRRGILRLGAHEMTDDDLACLVIRPRRGSDVASVGIVGGTGIVGLRLTDRLPYFVSGVGYPDVTILSPDVLEHGMKGIVAAGYFAEDWSVERGDWAMRAD